MASGSMVGLSGSVLILVAGCASPASEGTQSRGVMRPAAAEAGAPVMSAPSGGSDAAQTAQRAGGPAMATANAGRAAAQAGRGGAGSGSAGRAAAAGSGAMAAARGPLFSEDFEDGDLTKPSWIDADPELKGMWAIASADGSKVLAQTAAVGDWVIAVSGDYRWTDQTVQARVKLTSEPGKAGVFARVKDRENYYFLYLDGGSNLVLRKRVDNSSGDIMKVKVPSMQGTWYTLKLSVVGEMLQGYLDDKLLVSGTDSGVKTGGIGLGTSDCTAQFDDVSVHD